MTDDPPTPAPDQPAKPSGAEGSTGEPTREQKLAEIRARVAALRAAQAGGAAPAGTQASGAAAPTAPGVPVKPATPEPANVEGPPPAASGEEPSRDDKMAAIRARAEALRAARAGGAGTPAAAAPGAPARALPAKPATAAASLEVPVSSINPGGRPGVAPQAAAIEVYGTINNSVEIRGEPGENENLKKLLGGLGAYQNPLRGSAWQVDYRYYAEARRRLEAAGYTVTEKDFLGRAIKSWSPTSRGWTRVQS